MLVVADENIPYVREAFSTLGDVRTVAGRAMSPAAVREADVLLVRSVTQVDRALLQGSCVRFVGTATIGTDHVDLTYLQEAGIRFAAAPGSNANSVAEYVVAALVVVAKRRGWRLSERSIGVIGVGNVGSRVAAKARALGMRVLLNDPPLRRAIGDPKYLPLKELFECDVLTLHVPLEKQGPDATFHMVDDTFLTRMKCDALLINTSRGPVADETALLGALAAGRPAAGVLDVWEGEPCISTDLLAKVALGTPHIAGYSLDGKANGTQMIYRAACEFLRRNPQWRAADSLPPPHLQEVTIRQPSSATTSPRVRASASKTVESAADLHDEALRKAVLMVYPIECDDTALRRIATLPQEKRAPFFDRLRKDYPARREFHNITIRLTQEVEQADRSAPGAPALSTEPAAKAGKPPSRRPGALAAKLRGIGFMVTE